MDKKRLIVALIITTFVNAFVMMLASNMFIDDIFNIGVGFSRGTLFATLPAASIALFLVAMTLYLIRIYLHPDCKKRLSRLYLIYTIVFGAIGLVGAILAGVKVYGTFVGKNPFPGYLIIFMVLDVLLIGYGIYRLINLKKMTDDTGRIKVNFPYVMKTIGWFLFISLLANRLGTFLSMPSYVYLRNFHLTFPFYLWLLVPTYLGVIKVLKITDVIDCKKTLILAFIGLGCNVVLFAYTVIVGLNDTGFVSSLSQALPLERMAAKPVEIPIHFLANVGVFVALLLNAKKAKEDAPTQEEKPEAKAE